MKDSPPSANVESALQEIGAALFELRDALVELSMSMRDWQFETDMERRRAAETSVQQLLKKVTSD
jgi:hypothetical protein